MLETMTGSILKKLNAPGSDPGLEINPEVFQKLMASDRAVGDYFGHSVAVSRDGSTVVIGAYNDDDKGSNSGSAYIFTKQPNGSYLETQKLVAADGADGDNFGSSVAVSTDGSTIVVAALKDDDKGTESGSAYVFTKQSNGSYLQTQKLVASDGAASDYFGYSVAVTGDGSTVVIGAYWVDDKGKDSGSVYIFTKQANGSYLQTQKLVASDGAANGQFGNSVATSADGLTVVIGAIGNGDKGFMSGSAYIFTKQANGSYLQTQKLVASDGAAGDLFGVSVAVTGDSSTVVVGAYWVDDKGKDSGSVYIFTKQPNGSYLETQKLVAGDGAANDQFGEDVAVSPDGLTVVVGVYRDGDKGLLSGSAYIFTEQADGSYLETQKLLAADGAAFNSFGVSIAVSNTSVVVGAAGNYSTDVVYVY